MLEELSNSDRDIFLSCRTKEDFIKFFATHAYYEPEVKEVYSNQSKLPLFKRVRLSENSRVEKIMTPQLLPEHEESCLKRNNTHKK